VIAEIKKASRARACSASSSIPADIARSYALHGATCLSVLTDVAVLPGQPTEYLEPARATPARCRCCARIS
jgi:indole-3-glycerol phosphate synthase